MSSHEEPSPEHLADPFWADPEQYDLPLTAPVALWSDLERALEGLSTLEFAVGGLLASPPPVVHVRGSSVSWPLSEADRATLRTLASRSPCGQGTHTVLDPRVRSAWELTPDEFSLEGLEPALHEALRSMEQALGERHLVAELYKLQHYERGDFFQEHRDSVKLDGMIGTLILGLPGEHRGGELRVELRGEGRRFRLESTGERCSFLGFFADCLHELEPVLEGSRSCLVFSVRRGEPAPSLPLPEPIEAVLQALRRWSTDPSLPSQAVIPLAHVYPGNTPEPGELRGQDRALVEAVRSAAHALGAPASLCSIHLQREWYDTEGPRWNIHVLSGHHGHLPLPPTSLLWPWMFLWIEAGRSSSWTGNEGTYYRHAYQHTALLLERPLAPPPPLPDFEEPPGGDPLDPDDDAFFEPSPAPPDLDEAFPLLPEHDPVMAANTDPFEGPTALDLGRALELRTLLALLRRAHERRWDRLDLGSFVGAIHPSFFRDILRLSSHLTRLTVPAFSWLRCLVEFRSLHTLVLKGAFHFDIESVPASVMASLRMLVLDGFDHVEDRLPSWLETASNLEHLELVKTRCASLPGGLSAAPLRVLRVLGSGITALPQALGANGLLEELDVEACSYLQEIPSTVMTPALRVLRLGATAVHELDLTGATSLQRLSLVRCPLRRLPVGLLACEQLEVLELDHAGPPEPPGLTLPALTSLASLRWLNLRSMGLQALPELAEPSRLELLRCCNNPLCSLPAQVGQMVRLQELHASGASLASVPDLSALRRLRRLDLRRNPLPSLPGLSGKNRLEILSLSGCRALSLPEVEEPPIRLRSLALDGVFLGELPAWIPALQELEELYLEKTGLTAIPVAPGQWPALRRLHLEKNQIQDARPLAFLGCMEILDMSQNPLEHFPPLGSWPELRELRLSRTTLTWLGITPGEGQKLRLLYLNGTRLEVAPPIEHLTALQDLLLDQEQQQESSWLQAIEALKARRATAGEPPTEGEHWDF